MSGRTRGWTAAGRSGKMLGRAGLRAASPVSPASPPAPAPLMPLVPANDELRRCQTTRWSRGASPKWRPVSVLDEWVAREARPISLRQLMVFGRSLTEARLLSSANYVRTELPTRIAHRIRDLQSLPFVVVENRHIAAVYDLYYDAFDALRRVPEVRSLADNDRLCAAIGRMLRAHLPVIPSLAAGVLECACAGLIDPARLDRFMNTILRARISRRVIAEQHLALTDTFHAPWFAPGAQLPSGPDEPYIGTVFLRCVAREVVDRCARTVRAMARRAYGPAAAVPEIRVDGHLDASFPYILGHLEYIVSELLRNSVQAVVEREAAHASRVVRSGEGGASGGGEDHDHDDGDVTAAATTAAPVPPIQVTICESAQHVVIRVSDQGGGVPHEAMPYLWSFSKGPSSERLLENLRRVPRLAATMEESQVIGDEIAGDTSTGPREGSTRESDSSSDDADIGSHNKNTTGRPCRGGESLASLTSRPPNLRLGMGLPLSRVYAEYWAGSLTLHNLRGYGVDVFLQISKLGNKNEQLTTRACIDAV